ncbi:adenylate/guanylate cyclase domain-containing protein [Cupriavidus taiwanensis]|uniref:adenylate/guanylate cyclase domain-containing protein n=1 Tax=Cupriavidus taiwanensis TaxID=164546 RepID=UPI000E10B2F0|nr:adenylate/guanylate cyclase domain-containing protein [Cupriavidus taiwanensis]SPA49369.1 putative Adenylate cyclase [Cupriavidus taiwanensis]
MHMDRELLHQASEGSVLFADVSGSTRLYERAGNAAALAAVGRCIAAMKSCSEASQGRLIKTIGDEVMVLFPCAEQALQAALDIQRAVAELPPVAGFTMSSHIGFHHGPILSDASGDVFGDAVNLAARLSGLAARGQIITSKDAVADLPAPLRQMTRYLYPIHVRGRAQPVELYEAIWQQATDLTLIAGFKEPPAHAAFLTLRYRDTVVEMNAVSAPVTIGRDAGMTIVVSDRLASRFQAMAEPRAGRYVLIDRSSNGTHVSMDGAEPFILRRDEVTLRGHGWIGFGQWTGPSAECIEFALQVDKTSAGR